MPYGTDPTEPPAAPAGGPSTTLQYTQPPPAATPSGGATGDPLALIEHYESRGQNIPNYRYDKGHTAGGYWQITDTNWKALGPGLGIDVEKYPTALSADKPTQRLVAQKLRDNDLARGGNGYGDWAPYNPALARAIGSGGGYGKDPVIAAGNWKVGPEALAYEEKRPDTSLVWMSPAEYKNMVQTGDTPEDRPVSKSLSRSLAMGDSIDRVPELTVKGGKIIDQDGWRRAKAAEDAGVTMIPVAIRGLGGKSPDTITDMRGNARPFDFVPVKTPPTVQKPNLTGMPGLLPSPAASRIGEAAIKGAAEGFGDRPVGLPEDMGQALRSISGIVPVEAAARAVAVPIDLAGRGINAALYGAARGGGQAIGEMTGAAQEPGFDPGIGAIREVINPAQAFLAGTGAMPSAPRLAERTPVSEAPANMMSPAGQAFMQDLRGLTAKENAARDVINKRFGQDLQAGGATGQELASQLAAGRGEGMTLADVGGENIRGLLGNVARDVGPARERVKRWAVNRLGDVDRDSPIATNIAQGIEENLATGSARTEARALAEQRAASKPLWDEAMSGGNIIPVEEQVAIDYSKATRAEQTAKTTFEKAQGEADLAERAARDQHVTLPRQPTRLSTFLVRNGGVKNQGGEMSYILGDNKTRPGLINQAGKTLDDAALDAWEAGYLSASERPTTNDLLDAIAQDINRDPVYSELDASAAQEYRDALARNAAADKARQGRPGPQGQPKMTAKNLQFARDKATAAEAVMRRAQEEKADLAGVIEQARLDGTADAPGAVYSPYVGRLLKNPIIQQGVRRGYTIERNIADGENRPFNPKEYAIIGQEANGDPIVGAVPNMKLMAVAKEGLDAMLESEAYKDPLTGRLNKAGRAVKILRDGMLNELDRLNPAYKPARDKWAGDSALIAAVRDGKNFHKQSPEEIREWFGSASDSEKSFYRIGAADTMRDDLERRVFAGDPSKAIINSPRARNQLLPMFPSAEAASNFLGKVKRARTMFETPVEVLKGSQTAARAAEDLARREGVDTAVNALHAIVAPHSPSTLFALMREQVRRRGDPIENDIVARMLLDPKINLGANPGMELLRKAPLPAVQNMMTRMNQRLPSAIRPAMPRDFMAPGGVP